MFRKGLITAFCYLGFGSALASGHIYWDMYQFWLALICMLVAEANAAAS